MDDIRCKIDISMALGDLQMININCFQYDLSIEMQNTSFNKMKKPNFDIINNCSFGLYFIKACATANGHFS
jgi:hypothetical protein